jgi:hypothetical protein
VALCQARTSTKPLWGFPQVILIIPSHVPNNFKIKIFCLTISSLSLVFYD